MVRLLVNEGPARVRELVYWGVQFTREGGGLSLGREDGHSRRRVVRADDLTRREIERALIEAVAGWPNILVLENHAALDLLTVGSEPDRRCCGAMVLPPEEQPAPFVARASDQEMKRIGAPYALLDCTGIPAATVRARFPNILRAIAERGIDMLREPPPVAPAAHYPCGGVATDADGQTSLPGLFAAGETACTGIHGANRLASNCLLEAVVFANRAARRIRAQLGQEPVASEPNVPEYRAFPETSGPGPERHAIRDLMWEEVGIVRTDTGLADAEDAHLSGFRGGHDDLWSNAPSAEQAEVRNLAQVAQLIVRSARARKESRGLHFSLDHPWRGNERFLRDTILIA